MIGKMRNGMISRRKIPGKIVASGVILALLATQCAAGKEGSYRHHGDASETINQGILDAIRHGRHEYDLPAGPIQISSPIVIPPGTHNFTLVGAGSGSTVIQAAQSNQKALILVGQEVLLQNNWGLTNTEPHFQVQPLGTGAKEIQVGQGTDSLRAGEYAVLWDTNKVTVGPLASLYNHGELTRIASVSRSRGTLQLDEGAAREYDPSCQISPCSNLVCTDISLKGMTVDGAEPGEGRAQICIKLGLIEGLVVDDVHATHCGVYSIQTNLVRHATFTNDDVSDGAKIDQPGNGYGFTVCRSRFVKFSNCTGENTRHAFCCHTGATDVDFVNCTAPSLPHSLNDFNTHGFDERRIHISHCQGTMALGNPSWLGGAADCTIDDCDISGGLYFGPNVRNSTVRNSTAGTVLFEYDANPAHSPAQGYPDGIKLVGCKILGNPTLKLSRIVGNVEFDHCTLEQNNQPWGIALRVSAGTEGTLTLNDCKIINDSSRAWDSIMTVDASPELNLVFNRCEFRSVGGAPLAIDIKTGSVNLKLSNNDFYSAKPKKGQLEFVDLQGAPNADGGNNRVHAGN
jgi:hypothetical protein